VTTSDTTAAPGRAAVERSRLDRLVRQALLIEDAAPRSILDLRGSLVISAVRCVLTYALIPLLVPVIGWAGVLATPVSLLLGVAAIGLAIRSLRRVWLADYRHRWAYTAFITVVLVLLVGMVTFDARVLIASV
jgi:hypothetical protein